MLEITYEDYMKSIYDDFEVRNNRFTELYLRCINTNCSSNEVLETMQKSSSRSVICMSSEVSKLVNTSKLFDELLSCLDELCNKYYV